MPIFQTTVRTYSKFPIGLCWEVSFDLEHVAFLHRNTNRSFTLLYVDSEPDSKHIYDTLIYRATRRVLKYFSMNTIGFRKVISEYAIHQVEYLPLLRTTIATNCILNATDNPAYPCELLNEVVIDGPWFLYMLRRLVTKALARHQGIQNQEDETMRERMTVLRERGVVKPYSVLNRSTFDTLCGRFEECLRPDPNASESAAVGR